MRILKNYLFQLVQFSCLRLRQWPVTYLITLSDWIMSCQPGCHAVVTVCEPDWKHKWAAYESFDATSSFNNLSLLCLRNRSLQILQRYVIRIHTIAMHTAARSSLWPLVSVSSTPSGHTARWWRRCDVETSFWRHCCVVFAPCVRWAVIVVPDGLLTALATWPYLFH